MAGLKDKSFIYLMKYLPKKGLSRLTGQVMKWEAPRPLQNLALRAFASAYRVDVDQAELPLSEYKSLNSFFTRKLKDGARPIGGDIVHPADGMIISSGTVAQGQILQVKEISYSLERFLGDADLAAKFEGGSFWTTYLSPRDYHRVHYPIGGQVTKVRRIQGELWPVNSSFYNFFPNLFIENERVIVLLETTLGMAAVVMVGATNVGQIEVFLEGLKVPSSVQAGEDLGIFHFGSTVVTLVEKPISALPQAGQRVQFGQALAD